MTRKFSLLAVLLLGSLAARSVSAQATPATKPAPGSSSMQHQPTAPAASSTRAMASHTVWTKDQIKEAQTGLAKAGFYKGEPNGKLDRHTRKAIRAYQKANKLPVTGKLNNDLLTRLHSA